MDIKRFAFILLCFYTFEYSEALNDCPNQVYESACSIGGVRIEDLDCDSNINRTQLGNPPLVQFNTAQPGVLYTMIVVDADYTGRVAPYNYYLLWAVANAPGVAGAAWQPVGSTLAAYRLLDFSKNRAAPHRLVVFIFQHRSMTARISTPILDSRRPHFNVAKWVYEYRQIISCVPVGGGQIKVNI